MVVNLLEETEQALKNHGFKMKNVRCIRNAEGYITVADFTHQAANLNYDNGFGAVEIDPTLVIIGAFWWMTRENYDGLEGWVFHKKPKKPTLPAGDFSLRNKRNLHTGDFSEIVEKCGGYFDEQKR